MSDSFENSWRFEEEVIKCTDILESITHGSVDGYLAIRCNSVPDLFKKYIIGEVSRNMCYGDDDDENDTIDGILDSMEVDVRRSGDVTVYFKGSDDIDFLRKHSITFDSNMKSAIKNCTRTILELMEVM